MGSCECAVRIGKAGQMGKVGHDFDIKNDPKFCPDLLKKIQQMLKYTIPHALIPLMPIDPP